MSTYQFDGATGRGPKRRTKKVGAAFALWTLIVTLTTLVGFGLGISPAGAALVGIVDDGGSNDPNGDGQNDLTRFARDDATAQITWSWDEPTTIKGGNESNACALFDNDGSGDGLIDQALCLEADFVDGVYVISAGYPVLVECGVVGTLKDDRCGGPGDPLSIGTTSCTLAETDTDPFPSVVGMTDGTPGGAGDDYPTDLTATCTIDTATTGLALTDLINVCSFPAAANNGNNNPFDCVVTPGSGFIQIVKVADPDDTTVFNFTLSPAATSGATTFSITGSGSSDLIPVASTVRGAPTYSLLEAIPATWQLDSASCTSGGTGTTVPVAGEANAGATDIPILSGQTTVCTFTNSLASVAAPASAFDKEFTGYIDADTSGDISAGDTLQYDLTATNVGNVDLTNVTIVDALTGTNTNVGTLTPDPDGMEPFVGQSATVQGTYIVQSSDLGDTVSNTASADSDETDAVQDTENVDVPSPELSLTKTSSYVDNDGSGDLSVDDVINYVVTATNTGGANLTGVTVGDTFVSLTCLPSNPADLAPTEAITCSGSYTVDADDLGTTVINQATATSDQDDAPPVTVNNPVPSPELSLTKTSSYVDNDGSGDLSVDDVINYVVTATNTGGANLTGVTVGDTFVSLTCLPSNPADLAPTEAITCSGSYTVDADDLGTTVINQATATSDQDDAPPVTVNNPVPSPELSLTKTSSYVDNDGSGDLSVDDVINYVVTATNTGGANLTGVTVGDTFVSLTCLPSNPADLAPTEAITCSGSYTVDADDLGTTVINQATATSDQDDAPPVTVNNPVPSPELSLTKTSSYVDNDGSGDLSVDDVINYVVTATNTGGANLTGVTVGDTFVSLTCLPSNPADLAPTEAITCSGSYTVDADDLGTTVINQATATSDQDDAPPVTVNNPVPSPELSLTKTSSYVDNDGSGDLSVDDVINYVVTATNTGGANLTGVTVGDTFVSLTCLPSNPADLAPTEAITCSGSYTVDADDLGTTVINQATATSDQDDAPPVTVNNPVPSPELSLTKTSSYVDNDGSGDLSVDDVINYVVTATNTGGANLTGVTVGDTFVSLTCLPSNPADLAPTEAITCSGSYTVDADDLGTTVINQATATSDQDDAPPVTVNNPVPSPELSLTKTSSYVDNDGSGDLSVDDVINYVVTATNTGGANLTGVTVGDTFVSLTCLPSNPADLAPTEAITCSGSYTVDADDLGTTVINQATATSDQDDAPPVTVNNPVPSPELVVGKVLTSNDDADGSDDVSLGDTLTYTVTATNDGSANLTSVVVSDSLTGDFTGDGTHVACDDPLLAAVNNGDVAGTCVLTVTYTVTLDDANAGNVANTGTADSDQTPEVEAPLDVPVVQHPEISIVKSLASYDDNDDSTDITLGDDLFYEFLVTNEGDVTLDPVSVTDDTFGISVTCSDTSLDPTDAVTCTADAAHTVTLSEANAANVQNTATATGTPPIGGDVTAEDTLNTPVVQHPEISIVKSLASYDDNDDSTDITLGDDLFYEFLVTNEGDVTLDPVSVTDDTFGISVTCSDTSLDPTDAVTCTADAAHTVTLSEANAANVQNTATATGTPPIGGDVTAEDTLNTPVVQHPEISIVKSLASYDDNDDSTDITLGDDLFYEFLVTNEGDVTLDPVSVTDDTFGISVTCSDTSLDPTDAVTCTADAAHTVTLSEANAANVQNTATATGTPPIGGDVTAEDTLNTPVQQDPAHTLVKDFDPDEVGVGEIGTFTLLYMNTGNVTLSDIDITDVVDPRLVVDTVETSVGSCSDPDNDAQTVLCEVDSLAPGGSVTVTVTYQALAEDLVPVNTVTSGANYVFYFDNGYVLYGSTETGDATLLDENRDPVLAGGWSVEGRNQDIFFTVPYAGGDDGGFELHLSCSEAFIDGWGSTGPIEGEDDPDWNVLAYTVERFNSQGFLKDCTQTFPFDVDNTASALATPAGGTLTPNPIMDSDSVHVVNIAPIEVTRDRVRRGDVEIQYFNTSFEDLEIEIIRVEWTDTNANLEFASYQDGVDLGISGCDTTPDGCLLQANIDPATVLEDRSRDWLKLSFDSGDAPAGLTVTIVTSTGATFTYVYGA